MPAVSFARFEEEVLELYEPPLCKPNTAKQVRQVLREFREVKGVRKTSDLSPVAIARWIKAHPDRSAVTIESLLRCFRPMLKYAVIKGYLKHSPLEFRDADGWVREDKRPVKRPHPGSRSIDEMTAVLARADEEATAGGWQERRVQALVYVYAYLGLRAAEALHLWVSDVDLAKSVVTIRCHPEDDWTPKTLASAATLPVAPPLAVVLREWTPETGCRWLFPGMKLLGPWVSGGPGAKPLDKVKALGERAGVENLTIAAFRKTIGTYAKTWGLGPLELKALLRHTNVETQDWYDDKAADALRKGVGKIDFPRLAKTG